MGTIYTNGTKYGGGGRGEIETPVSIENGGTGNTEGNALGVKLKSDNTKAIKFGIDSNGNYGYYKDGADTVTPFKTGPDITDATAVQSEILNGKTAYIASGKVTGNMTNRGAVSATINPGGSYTIPAGYHNGSGTVTANNANLQTKTANVKPSANWNGANTNNATINPDSGYAGMSQVNVNVPMLRDHTLLTVDGVETPETVYNGDTSQSNNVKMLQVAPTKDGMSYTGSYLDIAPSFVMGNATAADVASGKTFSSGNGIQITGTASGGTDTSDATATASDILSGKTAYVNGSKITGNIKTSSSNYDYIVGYERSIATNGFYYPKGFSVTPSCCTTYYYNNDAQQGQTICFCPVPDKDITAIHYNYLFIYIEDFSHSTYYRYSVEGQAYYETLTSTSANSTRIGTNSATSTVLVAAKLQNLSSKKTINGIDYPSGYPAIAISFWPKDDGDIVKIRAWYLRNL